jgi:hypothetical protein
MKWFLWYRVSTVLLVRIEKNGILVGKGFLPKLLEENRIPLEKALRR